MDIRKNDTERAVNLLKLYKSQLNKPDEKSLRKAMDKLIEAIDSPLYAALLDIQEFYEHSLTYVPNRLTTEQVYIVEQIPERLPPPIAEKPKREKSKKKKHSKSKEDNEEKYEIKVERQNDDVDYGNDVDEPFYQNLQDNQLHEEPDLGEQNPWNFFEIEMSKGKSGYGFGVAGGYDKPQYEGDIGIFVTKIIPGGSADVDGRLRIDDVLVTVNGVNLENVTHATAVDTLKNAGANMNLIIRRLREDYYANVAPDVVAPEASLPIEHQSPPIEEHRQEYYEEQQQDDYTFEKFEISLVKRHGAGLGFSIQGGYDPDNHEEDSYISVSKLTPGGLAETDGRLEVNDILLMVDDQSLNGLTHNEAVDLLKSTGREVKLYIGRFIPAEVVDQPVVEKTEKKKKKKHKRDRHEE